MENKFYSVEELSEKLEMHIDTIRRYIREGRIKAIKFGRSYRIKEEEVKRILEEGV